ncbi:MAG: carboxy terminal-processing peptidase [Kiritimatiellia bacterium]
MIKDPRHLPSAGPSSKGQTAFAIRFLLPLLALILVAGALRAPAFAEWADLRSRLRSSFSSATPIDLPPATVSTNAPDEPAPDAPHRTKELKPEPVHPLIARNVARRLPAMHLTRLPFNDEIASRALTLFVDKLDYDRSVFLASDIEEFRSESQSLDDAIKKGDLSFAFRVFDLYKTRLRNRSAFVEELLKTPFDFAEPETYAWKRKDSAWPATLEAWDQLWRLKTKNEVVARMVSRRLQKEEEAAQTNAPAPGSVTNVNAAFKAWENLSPEDFVRKRYQQQFMVVDDHDAEWVVQYYLGSFCQAYDPHTDFLSAASSEDFDIDMKLSLSGVGAVLAPEDGVPKVVRIIPGGPAERDGRLQPGDKIVAVAQGDGEPVDILHWPLTRAVRLIRGPRGTKVVLSVVPASDLSGRTVKLDLVRDEVKLEEEAAKSEIREVPGANGKTWRLALLRLPAFYADMRRKNGDEELRSSSKDVRLILSDLATNRIDGLLLDLRDNGGGSLGEAVEMSGLFLRGPNQPVVQVKESWRVNVLADPDPSISFTGQVAVLINRQSASASEILAAALQDYGRAVMIGDSKTHGKGTVQTLVKVSDFDEAQGTIKVTAASFHRIGGGSTQLKGVRADIVIPSALECLEIDEQFLPYPMPWSMVPGVPFDPVADLQPKIEVLRKNAEARMAADPRYVARLEQLRRLDAMQKTASISLRFSDRIELARSERALMDLQTADEPAGKKKEGNDLVEQEAQRILVDMLEWPASSPAP